MFFFSFVSICGLILTTFLAGGGFAASTTTTVISATVFAGTIQVSDVSGFLDADPLHPSYFQIDEEVFVYTANPNALTNTFTSVVRAQADPQTTIQSIAASHAAGSTVATLDIKAMDSFIGYNISSAGAVFGTFDAITLVGRFFTNIPRYILWDYPFFSGMGNLIRYVLFAFSAGFVLSFAIAIINTAMGIFK